MQHPYEALKSEYGQLIAQAHIRPECEHVLEMAGNRLLHDKLVYQKIELNTGVPTAVLMALSEREMSGNLHCYLGNGQHLTMRTTIVPKNRGPFPDTPEGFITGALDALHLDGLDQIARAPEGWTLPRAAYESELWNGFGYRSHGIPSPYVFGGMTVQKRGKYVRDGVYDSTMMDPQLGTIAIMEKLFELDPSLIFADGIAKVIGSPSIVPATAPIGIGGHSDDVRALQNALNDVHATATPIAVDGVYGRGTMEAVREYQKAINLTVDGLAGPETLKALGFPT